MKEKAILTMQSTDNHMKIYTPNCFSFIVLGGLHSFLGSHSMLVDKVFIRTQDVLGFFVCHISSVGTYL
jgi:hypothetical protein